MQEIDITKLKEAIFQTYESYRSLLIRSATINALFQGVDNKLVTLIIAREPQTIDIKPVAKIISDFALKDDNVPIELKISALNSAKNNFDLLEKLPQNLRPAVINEISEQANEFKATININDSLNFLNLVLNSSLEQVSICHEEMDKAIEESFKLEKLKNGNNNVDSLSLKIMETGKRRI